MQQSHESTPPPTTLFPWTGALCTTQNISNEYYRSYFSCWSIVPPEYWASTSMGNLVFAFLKILCNNHMSPPHLQPLYSLELELYVIPRILVMNTIDHIFHAGQLFHQNIEHQLLGGISFLHFWRYHATITWVHTTYLQPPYSLELGLCVLPKILLINNTCLIFCVVQFFHLNIDHAPTGTGGCFFCILLRYCATQNKPMWPLL